MNYIKWIRENILLVLTLFLLVFIPLYPKKPLFDIVNTWVYIRAEDLVVFAVLAVWATLLIKRNITLKSPLTMPIFLFWLAGALATFHGVLIIFPEVADIFPNVAFLSYLRRIEYISMFFVAYAAVKDRTYLPVISAVVTLTLVGVIGYGLGQRYLHFPAYLTMNEEFAKGVPIELSPLSRIPSTFGGHYDLAAYLVLVIPLVVSLLFGVRNRILKILLFMTAVGGFGLLFMTVSRVSFFALIGALFIVLLFQKKKLVLFAIPIIAVLSIIFVSVTPALWNRFGSTVKDVDVLIDADTGYVIGHPKEVPAIYFKDKVVLQRNDDFLATASAVATPSAAISYTSLPDYVWVVGSETLSTGESLPQGSGYINLSLSPVVRRIGHFFLENTNEQRVYITDGNFIMKRVAAYDLSFTTRFQGEWPHAFAAFKRNIFFGSGYGSVSLAVDNNYLRLLGETGLLGFTAYLALFATIGIYIKKILPHVSSPLSRSFIIGFAAGIVGLLINAFLIDVFEASKIAFYMWLLAGITMGLLHFYKNGDINLLHEFKKIATSPAAIIIYLGIITTVLFLPMVPNYFVGDDFTWFRWVANAKPSDLVSFFTHADGFFYRPGAKLYFYALYNMVWLNQTVFHATSIFLHFIVVTLVFLLAKKIMKSVALGALAGFLFLVFSGHSEAIFWISATGFLFTSACILASLLFFILWDERKHVAYISLSIVFLIVGMLFHELGIIAPLLLFVYKMSKEGSFTKIAPFFRTEYALLAIPVVPYLLIRYISGSLWFSGDYSYNLIKLPFNIAGNILGYILLAVLGPSASPVYQTLRVFSRQNIYGTVVVLLLVAGCAFWIYKLFQRALSKDDRPIILFGVLFFFIALLPFVGLGNITSRYSYLASFGAVLILSFFCNKLYGYLLVSGRQIALTGTSVLVSLFVLFHIIQLQQVYGDWRTAGDKVRNFFQTIESTYQDEWAREPLQFYFVNVPIRHGEAWVFPVGLPDALWFAFQNPTLSVYQVSSLPEAFSLVTHPQVQKVFVFDDEGRVTQRKKEFDTTSP